VSRGDRRRVQAQGTEAACRRRCRDRGGAACGRSVCSAEAAEAVRRASSHRDRCAVCRPDGSRCCECSRCSGGSRCCGCIHNAGSARECVCAGSKGRRPRRRRGAVPLRRGCARQGGAREPPRLLVPRLSKGARCVSFCEVQLLLPPLCPPLACGAVTFVLCCSFTRPLGTTTACRTSSTSVLGTVPRLACTRAVHTVVVILSGSVFVLLCSFRRHGRRPGIGT
jgi:hypothetical protein